MNQERLALQLKYAGFAATSVIDDAAASSPDPQFVRSVKDRLGYFLESVDRCDVLFLEMLDGRLVFLVAAMTEEHLPLIMNAIAQERPLLSELGIDPREVRLQRDFIRIDVPLPVETDAV